MNMAVRNTTRMRSTGSGYEESVRFYESVYKGSQYANYSSGQERREYPSLTAFVREYDLRNKSCLEIGCGRGDFQDLVEDYIGVDLSKESGRNIRKPFVQCSAVELPFPDNKFDGIWTCDVLEHVPDPERALNEMRRVLKNGGVLFLSPAWQCRPWAAEGYPVRPYSDFGIKGKLIKFSIPIRDSIAFRLSYVFPRRIVRGLLNTVTTGPCRFRYSKLEANFDVFWTSDSDAVNSMDPFDAIEWFVSRGDECVSHPTRWRRFLVRTGPLVIRIHK